MPENPDLGQTRRFQEYPKGLGPIISEVADLLIQDVRQTNGRIDDLCIETNESIDDLAKQLDSRYAWLMAMLIACTSILITALGSAVAVLKFSFS